MIYFALTDSNRFGLEHYLAAEWGRPMAGRLEQVTYRELFRGGRIARGAWIFAAMDVVTDEERRAAERCWVAAREAGLPVLNHPLRSLRRYDLLGMLYRAGLNQFRAIRADEPVEGLHYPVYLRHANEHTGNLTPLLGNRVELERALDKLKARGCDPRAHLIVEFCETSSPDGLYRKYAVQRIGDRYIARHLNASRHWMVKSSSQVLDERLAHEEIAFVRDNPHSAWVREVFERARIEYGRIDYGVANGRPQAWEINLTPTITGSPVQLMDSPEKKQYRKWLRPSRECSHAAMREAFEALDPGRLSGGEIPVAFPRELEDALRDGWARDRWRRRRERLSAAMPIVRAIRPKLEQVKADWWRW